MQAETFKKILWTVLLLGGANHLEASLSKNKVRQTVPPQKFVEIHITARGALTKHIAEATCIFQYLKYAKLTSAQQKIVMSSYQSSMMKPIEGDELPEVQWDEFAKDHGNSPDFVRAIVIHLDEQAHKQREPFFVQNGDNPYIEIEESKTAIEQAVKNAQLTGGASQLIIKTPQGTDHPIPAELKLDANTYKLTAIIVKGKGTRDSRDLYLRIDNDWYYCKDGEEGAFLERGAPSSPYVRKNAQYLFYQKVTQEAVPLKARVKKMLATSSWKQRILTLCTAALVIGGGILLRYYLKRR